jgi:phosphoribosylamine---glycine ligase
VHQRAELEKAVEVFHPPIVVKADGLAAGKGVIICPSRQTAIEAAHGLFSGSCWARRSSRW